MSSRSCEPCGFKDSPVCWKEILHWNYTKVRCCSVSLRWHFTCIHLGKLAIEIIFVMCRYLKIWILSTFALRPSQFFCRYLTVQLFKRIGCTQILHSILPDSILCSVRCWPFGQHRPHTIYDLFREKHIHRFLKKKCC